MDPRAQNNGQLFLEMQQRGCSSAELRLVRDAYLMAMQLYSGAYTGSGKPMIVHDVGTASLALRYGGPFELVAASLLHGAYMVGDWGHYSPGLTRKKREAMRKVVGPLAEACIHNLRLLRWDAPSISALANRTTSFAEPESDVLFVKLVEILDRLLDHGAILFFRDAQTVVANLREERPHVCRLAERLGHPELGADLARAIDVTLRAELPPELLGLEFPGHASPLLVPWSCRKRPLLRLYRAFLKGVSWLSRGAQIPANPQRVSDSPIPTS